MKIDHRINLIVAIFILVLRTANSNGLEIIKIGPADSNITRWIRGTQIVCTLWHPISVLNIWSSATVDFNAQTVCEIEEIKEAIVSNTEVTDKSRISIIFGLLISKLKRFQDPSNSVCRYTFDVELFKPHCFKVDAHDQVEIRYQFTQIDPKLVFCTIFGVLLFIYSSRISKWDYFHYFSGISLGVLGSALIVLVIFLKYIPKKTTAVFTFLTGTSVIMFMSKWAYNNLKYLTDSFLSYIIGYFAFSALISWMYVYYRGPITNTRTINLIEWFLKLLSIGIFCCGFSHNAPSISILVAISLTKCIQLFMNYLQSRQNTPGTGPGASLLNRISYKLFPPQRRLLTQDEYLREGQEFTAKALEDLRYYCRSPQCDSWKIISRVKSPDKLARFVKDNESHISDEELNEYDVYSISCDLAED